MPRITPEQEDEFYRLKTERRALDQLMSQMTAYEAAIRVIVRHKLMHELAAEINSVNQQSTVTDGT